MKQRSATALPGVLTTVLFCPDDLLVLKSGAAGRRKLVDTALCQLRPGYAQALGEYQKLYESKSRILKDYNDRPSLLEPLPEFNYRMAQVGAILISYRARYLRELSAQAGQFHAEFSGGKETLRLRYQTVSTVTDPFAEKKTIFQQLLDHQQSHYRAELESGQCLSGPHKDDFEAELDGLSIKAFGSQGQTRTAAISLKLAAVVEATDELPKSFLVAAEYGQTRIYLTKYNAAILQRRLQEPQRSPIPGKGEKL